jgi:hypothetical protein
MPTQNEKKQVIKELRETALGDAYHGKALRVAKEIFPLSENELETIEAWETGKYTRDPFTYGMRLQDLAIRMYQELENEPVGVHFSDEPTHEPDSEPSGPGM